MTFCYFMGIVFIVIISCKLLLFLINILLSQYGRKLGCGVKWTSDKGEYAVIVGATSGIGTEFTREFASMGFNLVLISKNAEKLKKLESDYKDKYQLKDLKLVHVDFNTPESVDTVKTALDGVGIIAALVNCLGVSHAPSKFADYPVGFNSNLLNVNVVAPVLLMEMVLPKMVDKKRGVIINYSSQCGRFEFPYFSTFSATKSFISTLSDILAVEYAADGITVQNVEPLFVQSYMTQFKENFLLIPPVLSVYTSMVEIGYSPTTFGHWKHKLAALVLDALVFLLGSRITTKMIGCLIGNFVNTNIDKEVAQTKAIEGKSEKSQSDTSTDLSTNSSKLAPLANASTSSSVETSKVNTDKIETSKVDSGKIIF